VSKLLERHLKLSRQRELKKTLQAIQPHEQPRAAELAKQPAHETHSVTSDKTKVNAACPDSKP